MLFVVAIRERFIQGSIYVLVVHMVAVAHAANAMSGTAISAGKASGPWAAVGIMSSFLGVPMDRTRVPSSGDWDHPLRTRPDELFCRVPGQAWHCTNSGQPETAGHFGQQVCDDGGFDNSCNKHDHGSYSEDLWGFATKSQCEVDREFKAV